MSDLPQFLRDMIASPPRAGDGVHSWLFRVARQLHDRDEQDIFKLLTVALEDCGRRVPDREIREAVHNSKAVAWQPENGCEPVRVAQPAWPARDKARIDTIVREGFGLNELWEDSPVRFDTRVPCTETLVDALFPGNPLLCIGENAYQFVTRRRKEWFGTLSRYPLMVPTPMSALWGQTHEGTLSQHCLDNTGPRRFLVVEFDFSLKARNGVDDSEWAPLVRSWGADGISVADACAALLARLAQQAPLTIAVHSGGKSVHGWFYCNGQNEARLRGFMNYAHTIGADHATWCRCQFVRVPDGRRENGKRQRVYFFNPDVIA